MSSPMQGEANYHECHSNNAQSFPRPNLRVSFPFRVISLAGRVMVSIKRSSGHRQVKEAVSMLIRLNYDFSGQL